MNTIWFSQATSLTDALLSDEIKLTDIQTGAALLDLRHQQENAALGLLAKVAKNLGPALYLNRELLLVVATGTIDTQQAASTIASVIDPEVRKAIRLGRITGDSLLDQVEELASKDLFLTNKDGRNLIDHPEELLSVYAHTPPAVISDTFAEGVQIVLTQSASPGTMALGAYGASTESPTKVLMPKEAASIAAAGNMVCSPLRFEGINLNARLAQAKVVSPAEVSILNVEYDELTTEEDLPGLSYVVRWKLADGELRIDDIQANVKNQEITVTATFLEGHEFTCMVKVEENQLPALESGLNKVSGVSLDAIGPKLVRLTSQSDKASLRKLVSRLELLLHDLDLNREPNSLQDAIRPRTVEWNSSIPSESVLFGQECRYLKDWLDN